jgi:3-methylfumaryl-CoA hydratase
MEPGPWIGREERVRDDLCVDHARAVAAMLDSPPDGVESDAELPPLWHWFFFPALARPSELGDDGHPRRGGFLPPIALPRRVWAGGRVLFNSVARIGRPAERHSRIRSIEDRMGRTGRLTVVTVEHRIRQHDEVVISEEQDVIYREAAGAASASGAATPEALPAAEWEARFTTDPVLLFRFSALTFNGHRIHYDWRYATAVEGYSDLVVHGPLTALTLLERACARTGRAPASFFYRAAAPVFCGEEVVVGGRSAADDEEDVWAAGPAGTPVMRATITWKA